MIRKLTEGLKVRYTDEILAQVRANNPQFHGIGTIIKIEYYNPTPNALARGGKFAEREALARVRWENPVIGNVNAGTARYETLETKSHLQRV